ncbi:unnamed protein product [Clonostachys byssicola]|uniref:Polynucleotide 5'-hydroxyl-kinase GRC3 n=1 Tax=Clonostachys byssicola TaxID=160290 RepID=A0A9N9UGB8_9HYPO|nr:unnamed protein product [Clonostachys byssicola]
MSIPGLGQIPQQPETASTRIVALRPGWEWRFHAPTASPLVIKIVSGTAEKDGVELAPRNAYTFRAARSRILTWQGCEIEVDGRTDHDSVAPYASPADNPANALLNLHAQLNDMRAAAARERREAPRVLVAGAASTGKTTAVRTLASYATRQGGQPLVVNLDPAEGMLSLPGSLSASVFATVMDPEATDGWGGTPTSGPSTVPVKLPLVYYYGAREPEKEPDFYRELASNLAGSVSARLSEDEDVKRSGVIVDTMGVDGESELGVDLLSHIIEEFSINVVVVIGTPLLEQELAKRFTSVKTSLGEPIDIVLLDKSDGVAHRDQNFMQHVREACIKEYFFGDARRTLSPQIQQADFDGLVIYRASEIVLNGFAREEASVEMQHWTFAIMSAGPRDLPDTVRASSVVGFVYVSDVDEERKKIKLLAPVSGRLGDKPLVWGSWPEPFINLLG